MRERIRITPRALAASIFLAMATSNSRAVELARSDSVLVLAPDKQVAEAVLQEASTFAEQASREWFGKELPENWRVLIQVKITSQPASGVTWQIDDPSRKYHRIWIDGSPGTIVGPVLQHEVLHSVTASLCGADFPAWADEGMACQYETHDSFLNRQRLLRRFAGSRDWPGLFNLFEARSLSKLDLSSYATATSVVEYLVARQGKKTFVQFVCDGRTLGWKEAIQAHYGLRNMEQLQLAWQGWAADQAGRSLPSTVNDAYYLPVLGRRDRPDTRVFVREPAAVVTLQ